MLDKFLDKTIINLATLLISGAGIFAVLTKFSVPELHYSYFGKNPFAVKREAIDGVMTWLFTGLALSGLLLQLLSLVTDYPRQDRVHTTACYASITAVGIFAMGIVVYAIGTLGDYIARNRWLPEVAQYQVESFRFCESVIEHDGWAENQLNSIERMNEDERQAEEPKRRANWEQVDKHITRMEKLFDIPHDMASPRDRMDRLRRFLPLKEYETR